MDILNLKKVLEELESKNLSYFKLVGFINEQAQVIEDGEDDFCQLYFDLVNFIFEKL